MKKLKIFIMLISILLVTTACNSKSEELNVLTTIYPIDFIAKQIYDGVTISIYPDGANVNDYT